MVEISQIPGVLLVDSVLSWITYGLQISENKARHKRPEHSLSHLKPVQTQCGLGLRVQTVKG